MADLYELRDAVLALDGADRDNLRALLDREETRATFVASREETEVWLVVTKLTPLGSRHFRSLSEFFRDKRHGVSRNDFDDAVRAVFSLVAEAQPVRRPVSDHAALVELLFECVAKDLRRRHIEINQKTLIEATPRLRAAVEYCFPGYIEAGMLHRLIRVAVPA
jgi:hypothetical protein